MTGSTKSDTPGALYPRPDLAGGRLRQPVRGPVAGTLEPRRAPLSKTLCRWLGGHALALCLLAVLSWLGRGWGYLVLASAVLAGFGLGVSVLWALLARRSPVRASAFVARILRSFVFAELTLAGALVATGFVARGLSGPLGPFPGGPFRGSPSGPLPSEGLVLPGEFVQLQIPAVRPYTINTHGFVLDGCLHVGADFVFPFKRWVHTVDRNPGVLVRIDGALYEARALRVSDPEESRAVLAQVSRIRGVEPEDWLTEVWFFRVGCPE